MLKRLFFFFLPAIFLVSNFSLVSGDETINRQELISREMDCVSLTLDRRKDDKVQWADVCYAPGQASDETENTYYAMDSGYEISAMDNSAYGDMANHDYDMADMELKPDNASSNFKKGHFEMGFEHYAYKYTENIGVLFKGTKNGISAKYTYRFSENQPIDSIEQIFSDTNKVNMFRLEGRYSYGTVYYSGSGTWDNIPDFNIETRAFAGYDIILPRQSRITPLAGLGYRYLFNDFSSVPARIIGSTSYLSGYDRESQYFYLPLALEAETPITTGWKLGGNVEYDIFLTGKQVSHFENSVDTSDVNAGYDKLEHDQEKGMGWRASLRLSRELENFSLFFEPFYRYWHIEDSKVAPLRCGGVICGGGYYEPNNKTEEYGLNIGANF